MAALEKTNEQIKEELESEFLPEFENDNTLFSVLKAALKGQKLLTTQHYFGRKSGTHGYVTFAYDIDPGIPGMARFPPRKELIIKRIFVNSNEKSVVNKTCDALLADEDVKPHLTKIIIESIQHPEWVPSLERQGWTIYGDYTLNAFKEKMGGKKRKSKKSKRKTIRGGHIVDFNIQEKAMSFSEDISLGGFIDGYNVGTDDSCAANAFLLLGIINEINASFLAFFTRGQGLSWSNALLLLNRTFHQNHKFVEINESADVESFLEPGEATLGAVEPFEITDENPGHYFVIINHEGIIFIADSCIGQCRPFDDYKNDYGEECTMAAVWSSTKSASTITKQIILDILAEHAPSYHLKDLIGHTINIGTRPQEVFLQHRQELIDQCLDAGFSIEENERIPAAATGSTQVSENVSEGGTKQKRKTKKRHLKIKR